MIKMPKKMAIGNTQTDPNDPYVVEVDAAPSMPPEASPKEAKVLSGYKIPLIITAVIAFAIILYFLITALGNNNQPIGQQYPTGTAELNAQEQAFSNAIIMNRTDAPALLAMISNSLNATNPIQATYNGTFSISFDAAFTNLTYQLPFNAKFSKYGNDSRIDLYGRLISTLFGLSQGSFMPNSSASIEIFRISGDSYTCFSGMHLPGVSNNTWCKETNPGNTVNMSNGTQYSILSQAQNPLLELNSSYLKTLLYSLNETGGNIFEASYKGSPCAFIDNNFSANIYNVINTLSNEWSLQGLQQPASPYMNSTKAFGGMSMCLSYKHYIPFNMTINMRVSNTTSELGFRFDMNETSISNQVQPAYVDDLPGPIINYSIA